MCARAPLCVCALNSLNRPADRLRVPYVTLHAELPADQVQVLHRFRTGGGALAGAPELMRLSVPASSPPGRTVHNHGGKMMREWKHWKGAEISAVSEGNQERGCDERRGAAIESTAKRAGAATARRGALAQSSLRFPTQDTRHSINEHRMHAKDRSKLTDDTEYPEGPQNKDPARPARRRKQVEVGHCVAAAARCHLPSVKANVNGRR